jgi:hypothetical protein
MKVLEPREVRLYLGCVIFNWLSIYAKQRVLTENGAVGRCFELFYGQPKACLPKVFDLLSILLTEAIKGR